MSLGLLVLGATAASTAASSTTHNPALVELYSSEGCSSCPPAEALLRELAADDPSLLALELHVDYWNGLGWKDRFSSSAFSERQSRYAAAAGTNQVFTPQAIVDGRESVVASDRSRLVAALAKARRVPKIPLRVAVHGDGLEIRADSIPPGKLWFAVTEAGLESTVTRGENRGETLRHAPVVHLLTELGERNAGPLVARTSLPLDPAWRRAGLRVIAVLQDTRTEAVLALGSSAVDL